MQVFLATPTIVTHEEGSSLFLECVDVRCIFKAEEIGTRAVVLLRHQVN